MLLLPVYGNVMGLISHHLGHTCLVGSFFHSSIHKFYNNTWMDRNFLHVTEWCGWVSKYQALLSRVINDIPSCRIARCNRILFVAISTCRAYLLCLIVERSKKCVDFTFTLYFLHIAACMYYEVRRLFNQLYGQPLFSHYHGSSWSSLLLRYFWQHPLHQFNAESTFIQWCFANDETLDNL